MPGTKQDFPDAPGHEVRCPLCGRLLFVGRAAWQFCAVEAAEIALLCPARRGGWACKKLVPLRRIDQERAA